MKRFTIIIVGILLFLAGYTYTRWRAEFNAVQNNVLSPNAPKVKQLKAGQLPEFVIIERNV